MATVEKITEEENPPKKKVSVAVDLFSRNMGYWDVPQGTDCVAKTWITTKLGAVIGLVGSAYHLIAFPPKTNLLGLQRATSGTLMMATLGAVFGMTTCISAELRDAPDEPLNFLIGGCASGLILGARTHSAMTGASACLGLGTLAFFTKVGKEEGWKFSGPPEL